MATPTHTLGIVVSASKPKIKATMITLKCKTCNKTVDVQVKPGLSSCTFPRTCEGNNTDNANGQAARLKSQCVATVLSAECQQRPIPVSKETCTSVKRGLMQSQCVATVERAYIWALNALKSSLQ